MPSVRMIRNVVDHCDKLMVVLVGGGVPDAGQRAVLHALLLRLTGRLEFDGAWFALNAALIWMNAAAEETEVDPDFAKELALDQLRIVLRLLTEVRFE